MSNKLTLEKWNRLNGDMSSEEEWDRIQAHTAECVAEAVAEARAELLKDHFRIGEEVDVKDEYNKFVPGKVGLFRLNSPDLCWSSQPSDARRTPTTRPMTPEQILERIVHKYYFDGDTMMDAWAAVARNLVAGQTLEAMAEDLGINTTVRSER